jgi:uncharacterized protein
VPSAVGLYNKSLHYLDGIGVPEDSRKAFLLNEESAERGFKEAILAMGWFYLNGVGVEKNLMKAHKWYTLSARQGDVSAMFSLGQMAYDTRDTAEALTWFLRAEKKGHKRSTFWIGKIYWHGRGIEQDKDKAMQYFQKALKQKVAEARRTMRLFEHMSKVLKSEK